MSQEARRSKRLQTANRIEIITISSSSEPDDDDDDELQVIEEIPPTPPPSKRHKEKRIQPKAKAPEQRHEAHEPNQKKLKPLNLDEIGQVVEQRKLLVDRIVGAIKPDKDSIEFVVIWKGSSLMERISFEELRIVSPSSLVDFLCQNVTWKRARSS